jgi:hypothetical protein
MLLKHQPELLHSKRKKEKNVCVCVYKDVRAMTESGWYDYQS